VFAHQRKRLQVLFASGDALLTLVAFEIAYRVRFEANLSQVFFLEPSTHLLLLLFSMTVWAILGLRQSFGERAEGALTASLVGQTFRQCLWGVMLVVLAQYFLHLAFPLSRGFLCLFGLLDCALLLIFRLQAPRLVRMFHRQFGQPYHVALIGNPVRLGPLEETLSANSLFQVQIVARLPAGACAGPLSTLLSQHVVDEIIFAVDADDLAVLDPVFSRCDEEGVRTRIALDFFPHLHSAMTLDNVGQMSLLTFSAAPADEIRLLVKRFFDLALSALGVLVFGPAMALIALLVRLTSPGPVLFRQVRCGLNGRTFTMYKFRSMVENADTLKQQFQHLSEREIAFKLRNDPRVTNLGRFLRKYSLDELPQLFNILRGDMSLVGPRPPLPEEVVRYEAWQKRRLRMRPGLTCLWAIMGRDRLDFQAWMQTDISYIEHWSLGLDWSILLKTIPQVLAGKGAH
jgi:exopolysaccharide biosynthesis polyprenyl glycosylphosphotransferase